MALNAALMGSSTAASGERDLEMHSHPTDGPGGDPAATASPLDHLRSEIDSLDDALLELIERRLAASNAVAALKRSEGDRWLKLRPRREEQIVRRLIGRARLASPKLITHVWRNLLSYSVHIQAATELVLCASRNRNDLVEHLRERFGWAAEVRWVDSPGEAIDLIRRREAVAMIELDRLSDWWLGLGDQDEVRIFDSARSADGSVCALLLGRIAADDLPREQSFCLLDEQGLLDRVAGGEQIEAIAVCGNSRLCVSRLGDLAAPQ